MDLDNFKTINDRYGATASVILVLKSVAQMLQAMMRGGDTVFRWGGEEFGALIHADNIEEVGQLAERLRAKAGRYADTNRSRINRGDIEYWRHPLLTQ